MEENKTLIETLLKEINNLKEENIKVKIENNQLKEINQKLNEENQKIKEENQKLKEKIKTNNNERPNLPVASVQEENIIQELITELCLIKTNDIKSNIIKYQKEIDLIINRLKLNEPKFLNLKPQFELLYRATEHKFDIKILHNKCDGIINTLTLVKTNKNIKFGGFTYSSWDGEGCKESKNDFCFSLNRLKIYPYGRYNSIYCNPNIGPCFGGAIFEIYGPNLTCGQCNDTPLLEYSPGQKRSRHYDNQGFDFEINNGEKDFKCLEIEVFRVIFIK